MEIIKKQFKQVVTTASTLCDQGVTGNCFIIIPDTSAMYSLKIMLTAKDVDFGFFDVISNDISITGILNCDELSGVTSGNSICQTTSTFPTGITVTDGNTYQVTGTSSSRLSELRKYSVSGGLSDLYFTSVSSTTDGVNISLTNTGTTWTYYIGGITYNYDVANDITSFTFESLGYDDSNNFVNLPIIKDINKENVIDKPEINNNVFIIRQSQSVFQNIYRLQDVDNLSKLNKYGGGAKFNIINNS